MCFIITTSPLKKNKQKIGTQTISIIFLPQIRNDRLEINHGEIYFLQQRY